MDEEKMLQWKQTIETCMESGLPVKRWCKENHISSPSYYYWKKRIFPANEVPTNDTAFVEVPLVPLQEEKSPVISLNIKWDKIQFQISSKEEADLAAYFIGKLHHQKPLSLVLIVTIIDALMCFTVIQVALIKKALVKLIMSL